MSFARTAITPLALTLATTTLPAEPPNFLLVMMDDAGAEAFESYYSNPVNTLDGQRIDTPRISQLARDGVRFTQAHSTPLCTPSRLQLMTGQYNFRNYRTFWYIDNVETTFAQVLRDHGYATAIAGKWQSSEPSDHPSRHDAGYGLDQGVAPTGPTAANRSFDMVPTVIEEQYGFEDYYLHALNHTFLNFSSRRYWNPRTETKSADGTRTIEPSTNSNDFGPDLYAGFLKDFITEQAAAGTPFLAYYPMALPHDPWVSTPDSTTTLKNGSNEIYFDDMVEYGDRLLGELVDHLEDPNGDGNTDDSIAENTVVIFTSDNGTDGGWYRNHLGVTIQTDEGTIRGEKTRPTKYGTHVPFIISWPGTLEPGESDRMIDFTDIFPSLLELAGVPKPVDLHLDGYPILSPEGEILDNRAVAYGYYRPLWGSIVPPVITEYAQQQRYKLYGDGRMTDLWNDPLELSPLDPGTLTPEQIAIRDQLQAVLDYYDAQQAMTPKFLNGFTRQISDENLDGIGDRRANTVLIIGDNITDTQEYRVIAEFDLRDPNVSHLVGNLGGATLAFDVTLTAGEVPDLRIVALTTDENGDIQNGSSSQAANDFHAPGVTVAVLSGLQEGDEVRVDVTEQVREDLGQRFTAFRLEGVDIDPANTPGANQLRIGGVRGEGMGLETSLRLILSANGDLNEDGQLGARDINLLSEAVIASDDSDRFDLNRDGSPSTGEDRDTLISTLMQVDVGDANLDGAVNLLDFVTLRDHFGEAGGWETGDFSGNLTIDVADYQLLRTTFGPPDAGDLDTNGDGRRDLIDYAFGLLDDDAVATRLPQVFGRESPTYAVRVFSDGSGDLRTGYRADGVTYTVEVSDSGRSDDWQAAADQLEVVPSAIDHDDATTTFQLQPSSGVIDLEHFFIRTRVLTEE